MMSLEELKFLTSKDRILLYLSDFHNMEDRYELPSDLVQQSIAYGTGIQRKHLSQYLDDLMGDGLVIERKAHVHGMKQRMNGYYLSALGHSRCAVLRDKVGGISVPVSMRGEERDMTVSEIDDATSHHVTLNDIAREAIQRDGIDMTRLESVESEKRKALEEKEQDTEVYRRALLTTWRDGRVTATERFLMEELRKHLNISDEQQRAFEAEIVKKLAQDHMEFRRIYRAALEVALADGDVSGPEALILETLRRTMRISREENEELKKEVESYIRGPSGQEKNLLDDALRIAREEKSRR